MLELHTHAVYSVVLLPHSNWYGGFVCLFSVQQLYCIYILVYCSSSKLMNARYRIDGMEKEGGLPYGLLSLIIGLIILQIRNKYFIYFY